MATVISGPWTITSDNAGVAASIGMKNRDYAMQQDAIAQAMRDQEMRLRQQQLAQQQKSQEAENNFRQQQLDQRDELIQAQNTRNAENNTVRERIAGMNNQTRQRGQDITQQSASERLAAQQEQWAQVNALRGQQLQQQNDQKQQEFAIRQQGAQTAQERNQIAREKAAWDQQHDMDVMNWQRERQQADQQFRQQMQQNSFDLKTGLFNQQTGNRAKQNEWAANNRELNNLRKLNPNKLSDDEKMRVQYLNQYFQQNPRPRLESFQPQQSAAAQLNQVQQRAQPEQAQSAGNNMQPSEAQAWIQEVYRQAAQTAQSNPDALALTQRYAQGVGLNVSPQEIVESLGVDAAGVVIKNKRTGQRIQWDGQQWKGL